VTDSPQTTVRNSLSIALVLSCLTICCAEANPIAVGRDREMGLVREDLRIVADIGESVVSGSFVFAKSSDYYHANHYEPVVGGRIAVPVYVPEGWSDAEVRARTKITLTCEGNRLPIELMDRFPDKRVWLGADRLRATCPEGLKIVWFLGLLPDGHPNGRDPIQVSCRG